MTSTEYNTMVAETPLTVVDIFTQWCGPCKALKSTLDNLEKEYADVKFVRMDAEEESEVSSALRIRSVPTLLFYKNGELKDKTTGAVSEQTIKEKIENLQK